MLGGNVRSSTHEAFPPTIPLIIRWQKTIKLTKHKFVSLIVFFQRKLDQIVRDAKECCVYHSHGLMSMFAKQVLFGKVGQGHIESVGDNRAAIATEEPRRRNGRYAGVSGNTIGG